MKSITKRTLENKTLTLLIERAFGLRASIIAAEEVSDGYFNTVWRVAVDPTGTSARPGSKPSAESRYCILKVAPPPQVQTLRYEQGLMHNEAEILTLTRKSGLPVPELLYFDTDADIVDAPWLVMSALPGTAWRYLKDGSSEAERAVVDMQAGRISAGINKIRGAFFGYPNGSTGKHRDWPSAFASMIWALYADAQDVGCTLPITTKTMADLLKRCHDHLAEVRVPTLVHWDLWEGNILVTRNSGADEQARLSISGIIDCERAFWGEPLMEFGFRSFAMTEAFGEGYSSQRETNPLSSPRAPVRVLLYDLYLLLILIVEPHFRKYEGTGPEVWAATQIEATMCKIQELLSSNDHTRESIPDSVI